MIAAALRWLLSPAARRRRRKVRAWVEQGRAGTPPSAVKQGVIRDYGRRFGLGTFVETGTHRGGTVMAVRRQFRRIYSIEIDEAFWRRATARFARSPHITILRGDSGEVLPALLRQITEPCLFWLDGHYSGPGTGRGTLETPIRREVQAILDHPVTGHVILVDDAREFGRGRDYPTLEDLRRLVHARDPRLVFDVEGDVIRIHPPAGRA